MAQSRWIESEEQKAKAEKVVSMLLYKIKQGIATDEEKARHQRGIEDLAIYDWGTDSYQGHVPNQIAALEERKQSKRQALTQRKSLIAPAPRKVSLPAEQPQKIAVGAERPSLTRRPGPFAL